MKAKILFLLTLVLPLPLMYVQLSAEVNDTNFWQVVSISLAAIAYSYLVFVLFLGARPREIDYHIAQKYHRVLAVIGIVAVVLHNQTEGLIERAQELHDAGEFGENAQTIFLIIGGLSLVFLATRWIQYTPQKFQALLKNFSFIRYDWVKWIHHLQLIAIFFMVLHVLSINIGFGTPKVGVLYLLYAVVAIAFYIPLLYAKFARKNAVVKGIHALSSSMFEIQIELQHAKTRKIGQVVWLRINKNEHPFTIIDTHENTLTIAFKKEGVFTTALTHLKQGDAIYVSKGYSSKITFRRPTVYIAGGSGITKAITAVKQWEKAPDQPFYLYWSVRTNDELVFDAYFRQLQQTTPNFYYMPFVTREGNQRRLTVDDLAQNQDIKKANCIICASPAASHAFTRMLKQLHVRRIDNSSF